MAPRLPNFDRVLVVVPPHGGLIASGTKKALVKSKRYQMWGEDLLVVERKAAIAVMRAGEPIEISLTEFRRRRPEHLVSEKERLRWWPTKRRFYLYPIVHMRRLRSPVPVDYPNGAQVFVRKENLRLAPATRETKLKGAAPGPNGRSRRARKA